MLGLSVGILLDGSGEGTADEVTTCDGDEKVFIRISQITKGSVTSGIDQITGRLKRLNCLVRKVEHGFMGLGPACKLHYPVTLVNTTILSNGKSEPDRRVLRTSIQGQLYSRFT